MLRSSPNFKAVLILPSLKLHYEEICELYCLSSTLIVTTLVYSIQPSPICFDNILDCFPGFQSSSHSLQCLKRTKYPPSTRVGSYCSSVYSPTRTSTLVSQSQSTSILSEALLLPPLPRPDQSCSLKAAGMPAPQSGKCSTSPKASYHS